MPSVKERHVTAVVAQVRHKKRTQIRPILLTVSILCSRQGATAVKHEISSRLDGNPRFAQLWRDGAVGGHAEERKTIRHPDIGEITVDCDVLSDSDTDLKIVIYTTVPGSEDETKLDLARVAGTRPASPATQG